ncbi:MAG: GxxExxY protein [Bacteroidota bacterium]
MIENNISYIIRGCVFDVYNELGPGLLESVYESALAYELREKGLNIKTQVALPVVYKETQLELGFRIDILVEDKVIIELKSIETILDVHHKQVLTYLKLTNIKLGLLINFNSDDISKSIYRKVNNL